MAARETAPAGIRLGWSNASLGTEVSYAFLDDL